MVSSSGYTTPPAMETPTSPPLLRNKKAHHGELGFARGPASDSFTTPPMGEPSPNLPSLGRLRNEQDFMMRLQDALLQLASGNF